MELQELPEFRPNSLRLSSRKAHMSGAHMSHEPDTGWRPCWCAHGWASLSSKKAPPRIFLPLVSIGLLQTWFYLKRSQGKGGQNERFLSYHMGHLPRSRPVVPHITASFAGLASSGSDPDMVWNFSNGFNLSM